eukprot:15302840-Ditylum_brightwellii.AAC.1
MEKLTSSNKAFIESNCTLSKNVTKLQGKYTKLENIIRKYWHYRRKEKEHEETLCQGDKREK